MRKLLFCVVLIAAVVLGVGFWRGWFLVDRERVNEDTKKAVDTVKGATGKVLESSRPKEQSE